MLKKLNVSYCSSLTDKGMEYIGRLEELCDLEMRGLTNVTGTGLQSIAAGCKRLTELDLKHCGNIQDSGFWALAYYSKNMRQVNFIVVSTHNFSPSLLFDKIGHHYVGNCNCLMCNFFPLRLLILPN